MRQHLYVDPSRVHGCDAPLTEVEQLGDHVESEQLLAIVAALRARRKALLLPRQDEMFLERNDLHVALYGRGLPTRIHADTVCGLHALRLKATRPVACPTHPLR